MKLTVADVIPGLVQHAICLLARQIVSQAPHTVHFPRQQLRLETKRSDGSVFTGNVYRDHHGRRCSFRGESVVEFQEALREVLIDICTSEKTE